MKKNTTVILFVITLCLFNKANAQNTSLENDSKLFDFWIGNWDVSWTEDNGKKGYGTNTVTKTLDGKVINEDFQILEGQSKGFKGHSISTFLNRKKNWKQTWMDSNGGYYDFIGGIKNGNPIFKTKVIEFKGKQFVQRMTFKDIKKNSFIWDWESSTDGGKTWTLQWQINYKRKVSVNNLPHPKAPKETIEYGQLVGEWDVVFSSRANDSKWVNSNAYWRFEYILEGHAVQDYWINYSDKTKNTSSKDLHGTNIRIYNPKLKKWQCIWIENGTNSIAEVWESYAMDNGDLILKDNNDSWTITFYNITQNSFDWKWDFKQPDGSMKTNFRIKATRKI